jgi:hypothetical protein
LTDGQNGVLNQQVTNGYRVGFNRLTSRTVTSGTVQNYTYTYDRYGSRITQAPLQTGYNFNPTINPVNNQITTSGFTYDAAGNMTHDNVHSYTYDAEWTLALTSRDTRGRHHGRSKSRCGYVSYHSYSVRNRLLKPDSGRTVYGFFFDRLFRLCS